MSTHITITVQMGIDGSTRVLSFDTEMPYREALQAFSVVQTLIRNYVPPLSKEKPHANS